MKELLDDIIEKKSLFIHSCVAAVVLCFLTHAFTYYNAAFIHDRCILNHEIVFDSAMRAKWMAQYWDLLTGFAYLPWLTGALTIFFFAISICLMVDVLEIRNVSSIWMIAGVCITQSSVVNAHMFWPHEILAALPLAIISAWIWKNTKISIAVRVLTGAVFVGLSLATYGAYTNVSLCIVMIVLLFELLDGGKEIHVLLRGIEYIVTFLIGMAFYYIVLRCFLHFQELKVWEYMNEEKLLKGIPKISEIFGWMKEGWYSVVIYMQKDTMSRFILLLSIILLFLQIYHLGKKNLKTVNALLMLLIMGLFPLGSGLIHVMAFGAVNERMSFAYVMPFVLVIALADRERVRLRSTEADYNKQRLDEFIVFTVAIFLMMYILIANLSSRVHVVYLIIALCGGVYVFGLYKEHFIKAKEADKSVVTVILNLFLFFICAMVCRGILEANIAYMQIEKMDNVNKSLVTRIVNRVECCEGFEGNEVVVLAGNVQDNDYVFYNGRAAEHSTWELWGSDIQFNGAQSGITYSGVIRNLLWTDAGLPLGIEYYSAEYYTEEEKKVIEQMPNFPVDGSIKKVRDTVVVKFSDNLADWE